MDTTSSVELLRCYVCSTELKSHPLYEKSGAKYCPDDGDYFIQRLRDTAPTVIFRPYPIVPWAVVPESESRNTRPPKIASLDPLRYVVPRIDPLTARLQNRSGHPGLRIRCDQTGIIFPSLKEASIAMFLGRGNLSMHINGKVDHVKGYTFTVLDENDDPPFVQKPRVNYIGCGGAQRVRCEQTGQIFESARAAARAMKLNRNNMWVHMNDRTRRPRVGGYSFVIITDET